MNVFGERLKSLRDKNKQSINELVLELNKNMRQVSVKA